MAKSDSKRKKPTENMGLVLFDEVGGICPKCTKPLMRKSKGQMTKLYEIAHIYPNSPRPHELELLKDEERLSEDVDDESNLIALCRDCHKVFDNPRTIDGYREIVSIKKELQRLSDLRKSWFDNSIDDEINKVIASLTSFSGDATEELSLDAITVESKSDETLNGLVKLKIKNNVRYFYTDIKSKFSELDKAEPYTSDTIYSQVKTYYLKLKKQNLDQTQIFSALADWIKNVTNCENTEASEIIVSFFVQNCEVYS
ncbi:ABC-three component system protein [Vibrio metschnikovii]|uniref:ABC-three component system protein n=1 Tax=Vibrio metschnikovii TaxID=28172 RepID=UPI001C2FC893|nr:ABC-three component system protein [Vibrio metschnikovii]